MAVAVVCKYVANNPVFTSTCMVKDFSSHYIVDCCLLSVFVVVVEQNNSIGFICR